MADGPIRVLFVCTGNRAFDVDSAGTEPKGVNPYTVRILGQHGIDWSKATSKSVQRFLGQSFDHVITVCDQARQVCPVFPGHYNSLHWDLEDPAEVTGSGAEKAAAFRRTYAQLATLIPAFIESATPLRARTAGR